VFGRLTLLSFLLLGLLLRFLGFLGEFLAVFDGQEILGPEKVQIPGVDTAVINYIRNADGPNT
jgi:hypothetical protein